MKIYRYLAVLTLFLSSYAYALDYRKITYASATKSELNISELGMFNFIISGSSPSAVITALGAGAEATVISGSNHDYNGETLEEGGKPAIRLSTTEDNLTTSNITLEGTPSSIEGSIAYEIDTKNLAIFLRKNADLVYSSDTTLSNTSIGSSGSYKIVYVNNARLTLSNNFTGHGVLYIEDSSLSDHEPLLQMLNNAAWYGLIIINQPNGGTKTSKILLQGSEASFGIEDFVIVAADSLTVGNNLDISSGGIAVAGAGGTLTIGTNANITGDVRADNLSIGNNANIEGDLYYNTFSYGNNFSLSGSQITPSEFPFVVLPDFPVFTQGNQSINLSNNSSYYLNEGSYNNIALGNNSILYLNGGDYNLNSIYMGNNAQIIYLAKSTINVKERVTLGNNARIYTTSVALDSTDCVFYIEGYGYSSDTNVFNLGNDPGLYCNIYAPNSKIQIRNNSDIKGAIIAKTVTTDNDASASIVLESAFAGQGSESSFVKVYGAMLFIGNKFQIPNSGKNARCYYSQEILQDINTELSLRPANFIKWKEAGQ
ncbi:MAG: hypothetical protein PHQ54_01150 [Candidatus Omnitrophica bacterium]|nr:hypothetical protein [Candidatus Omnitrophota bacterium]